MILIFLLNFSSSFAKNGYDGNSTLSENRDLLKILDKTKQVNLFGQPRFNTSCDLESLEATNECEVRVSNFFLRVLKFLTNCIMLELERIKLFILKLFFSNPYSKQDLQLIFSECSENCEDQPCVAKCQRDFYISIDCKRWISTICRKSNIMIYFKAFYYFFRDCPCHWECSAGCKSCNHWTCTHPCDDPANNPETDKVRF